MSRATGFFLLLLLGLIGGAAWLILGGTATPDGGFSEHLFEADDDEERAAPGEALSATELDRTSVADEAPAGARESAEAELFSQKSFERATLRGRRVDALGEPLPGAPLYVMEIGPKLTRGNTVQHSEAGVFLHSLTESEVESAGSWLCLQYLGDGPQDSSKPAPETYVFTRAVDPVTHLQDVGDLVSGSGSIALAGLVTDLDHRPLANARVEVIWSPSGEREGRTAFSARTDADGRFQLLGTWPDIGKWSARGSHPEYLPTTLRIAPGTANLVLQLPRGSALRGRILVDPDISLELLTVKIRSRRDGTASWQNTELHPDPKTGEFAATGLTNGWSRVRVYDTQMRWNLYFQYGIPLPSGLDAQVPELQPLDLRGRLKNCKLTALRPDGSLAEDLTIVVHAKKKTRALKIPNPLECIVPRETIEITVAAKGCREEQVFITGAEQTIRLLASPRIAFLLGRLPPLEEGFSLRFHVRGAEGTAGNWTLKLDDSGRAELDLTPGSYTLSAQLNLRLDKNGSVGTSLPCAPDEKSDLAFVVGDDGSPGRVQIKLDPTLVKEQMEQLRASHPR